MSFTVVYDANVLYPAPLRDLLVRVGMTGVVRAKWTDRILDEVFRNLLASRPDLTEAQLRRTRTLMSGAIRDVRVTGYEVLIDSLTLPDPDDRHVLAAAIASGAQSIITHNLRDFPASALEPHGIEAMPPDEFVLDLLDLAPGAVLRVLNEQQQALKSPAMSLEQLMDRLQTNGLLRSMMQARLLLAT